MRYAAYQVTGYSLTPVVARLARRRGLVVALIAALHRSRRRQAEQVLRRHAHLIARAERRQTFDLQSRTAAMSVSEEPSRSSVDRSSAGLGVPSEKMLLAAIAIAFRGLHILAGVMLLRPSGEAVAPQPASLSHGD